MNFESFNWSNIKIMDYDEFETSYELKLDKREYLQIPDIE